MQSRLPPRGGGAELWAARGTNQLHLIFVKLDVSSRLARPALGVVLDWPPHHHLTTCGVQPHTEHSREEERLS